MAVKDCNHRDWKHTGFSYSGRESESVPEFIWQECRKCSLVVEIDVKNKSVVYFREKNYHGDKE